MASRPKYIVLNSLEMECRFCQKMKSKGFVLYPDGSEWPAHKLCAYRSVKRIKIRGMPTHKRLLAKSSKIIEKPFVVSENKTIQEILSC